MDSALAVLASAERRKVIEYFDHNDTLSASVQVLSDYLTEQAIETDGGVASGPTAEAALHHVHLPKLADYGVVEYDSRSGEVRYRPDERLEALVEFTSEL